MFASAAGLLGVPQEGSVNPSWTSMTMRAVELVEGVCPEHRRAVHRQSPPGDRGARELKAPSSGLTSK